MRLLSDILRQSLFTLEANKLRAFLTTFGRRPSTAGMPPGNTDTVFCP